MDSTTRQDSDTAQLMEQILYEVKRVVVGQDRFLERVMVAILAQGHLLVEGVPGLAKTLTDQDAGRSHQRPVQAHPVHARPGAGRPGGHAHLQPEDRRVQHLAGPGVHQPAAGRRNQPRARQGAKRPARSDAGAAGDHRPARPTRCPSPFLVLATQNPIETEGTYPLPEAQVDRFMMKVLVGLSHRRGRVRHRRARHRSRGECLRGCHDAAAGRAPARMPARVRRSLAGPVRGAPGFGDPDAGKARA